MSDVPPTDRSVTTLNLLRQSRAIEPVDHDRAHELRDQAVLLNLEVAESVVSRYRNRGVPTEDLLQVAAVGLVKAARGFDPAKGDNFLGYAIPTIIGEVKRYFRDNAWVVKPPRRIQELQAEVSGTRELLTGARGEVPTPDVIADALDVGAADVREAMSADGCFSPGSLDRPQCSDDTTAVGDLIGDIDSAFDRIDAVVALAPACRRLGHRDRRIVYLRFFHDWTQARIAEEFGITQMQVSRLLTRILGDLRESIGEPDSDRTRAAAS